MFGRRGRNKEEISEDFAGGFELWPRTLMHKERLKNTEGSKKTSGQTKDLKNKREIENSGN